MGTAIPGNSGMTLPPDNILFGHSPVMLRLKHLVDRVAPLRVPILIVGATGTGKEAIANYIHLHSPWKEGPFIKVNCAAIPGSFETELFGFEPGAFTGVLSPTPWLLQLAGGGTLLLDDIPDLGLAFQTKLLHFLQRDTARRMGGQQEHTARTLVICTTNRHLESDVAQGRFRRDLYRCITRATLSLPRLRERTEDISSIADYLLSKFNKEFDTRTRPLSAALQRQLRAYSWPGNMWELQTVVRRYALLGTTTSILKSLGSPLEDSPRTFGTTKPN